MLRKFKATFKNAGEEKKKPAAPMFDFEKIAKGPEDLHFCFLPYLIQNTTKHQKIEKPPGSPVSVKAIDAAPQVVEGAESSQTVSEHPQDVQEQIPTVQASALVVPDEPKVVPEEVKMESDHVPEKIESLPSAEVIQ